MKEKKDRYSLDAFDTKGKLAGKYPITFDNLPSLAQAVQDVRRSGLKAAEYKLVRVDMTEKEAGQRQTEILFGSIKAC